MLTFPLSDPLWRDLARILARRCVGYRNAAEAVAWALAALEQGHETPHLLLLAGEPRTGESAVVDEYLAAAVEELGFVVPDDALRRRYLVDLCRGLLSGDLKEEGLVREVDKFVTVPLGYPSDLYHWVALGEGLAEFETARPTSTWRGLVRKLAAETVALDERKNGRHG